MSLSPSKRNANQSPKPSDAKPLSLSQALLITAGLAGLVGLGSGALIRFSLANSPNANFLSPLQTFPTQPDWTPELSQGTADSHYLPDSNSEYESATTPGTTADGEASTILTFEPAEPVESSESSPISESLNTEVSNDIGPVDTATFDAFAARDKGRQRTADPLDLLQKGPNLAMPRPANSNRTNRDLPYDSNSSTDTQGDLYDDSERYTNESESGYSDDYGGGYEDNYYPPVEEPVDSNGAYYDESDRW